MLTKVRIQNYKLLKDVTLDLGRLAVLVGPNGAGKTSVLEAVDILTMFPADGRLQFPELPYLDKTLHHGTDELALQATLAGGHTFGVTGKRLDAYLSLEIDHQRVTDPGGLPRATEWGRAAGLGRTVSLTIDPRRARSPSYSDRVPPLVTSDGDGLASVLQYLQTLQDGRFEALSSDMQAVVPSARRVRAAHARVKSHDGERTGAELSVDWEGRGWVSAAYLSEGTLIVLGILTAIHVHEATIILVEDIDRALHPAAQERLIDAFRRLLDVRPNLQILATTHSPFILDKLDASEVFVVGPSGPGESTVTRLDHHPRWAERSGYLHPGEFWNLVGEDWVGAPAGTDAP
jgi:predicted ATPase